MNRGKRRKSAHSMVTCSASSLGEDGFFESVDPDTRASNENRAGSLLESSSLDGGAFASRCSVKLINEVVSRFDATKLELVKSTGFQGVLFSPPMKQINRKFTLWLMSCVDDRAPALIVGDHIRISFNKYDVGHVFGIPSTGRPVLDTSVDMKDAKETVVRKYLGAEFLEQRSVKIAQEIVERRYISPMSKEECDKFRAAFVVFVVSNLLCPSAKYDYAAVDYWNAIQHPDEICLYDWCGYVLSRLLESVCKLKQDISNNLKCPIITGCSIFLQVLYLDSLEIEGLTLPHNVLPRVRVFPFDRIRRMMMADQNYLRYCRGDANGPLGKLRHPARCLYSWALQPREENAESRSGAMLAVWESTVAMVKLLNIPLEAAGPLFVAVLDFQEQVNGGLFVSGLQAIKFLTVLVLLMMPYASGFRYRPSWVSSVRSEDNDIVGHAVRNGIRLLSIPVPMCGSKRNRSGVWCSEKGGIAEESTACKENNSRYTEALPVGRSTLNKHWVGDEAQRLASSVSSTCCVGAESFDLNFCAASTMAKFYSAMRKDGCRCELDLNEGPVGDIGASSSGSLPAGFCALDVPSPWDIGFQWGGYHGDAVGMLARLSSMENDERLAIVHHEPSYIQVTFGSMFAQFSGFCEMEVDLFDCLLRIARQDDDRLYEPFGSSRWRIFFESDFMASIISGKLDLSDSNLRYHLSLPLGTLDMSKCKLVFMPALLQCQWVCYVWNTETNVISIFDPGPVNELQDARIQLIERTCFMLKLALKTLSDTLFSGLAFDVSTADICILNIGDSSLERMNRSGVLCSMFYRCFDGSEIMMKIEKIKFDLVVAKLLEEIGKWKENKGAFHIDDDDG